MTKKINLETLKSVPGRSISHYFCYLLSDFFITIFNNYNMDPWIHVTNFVRSSRPCMAPLPFAIKQSSFDSLDIYMSEVR